LQGLPPGAISRILKRVENEFAEPKNDEDLEKLAAKRRYDDRRRTRLILAELDYKISKLEAWKDNYVVNNADALAEKIYLGLEHVKKKWPMGDPKEVEEFFSDKDNVLMVTKWALVHIRSDEHSSFRNFLLEMVTPEVMWTLLPYTDRYALCMCVLCYQSLFTFHS